MAYTPKPTTQVTTWMANYVRLRDNDLANAANEIDRTRAEARMKSLAITIQRRINADIQTVRSYFDQHLEKVNEWTAEAEAEIKHARATAASYRKNPNQPGLPPQLDYMVKKLAGLETNLDNDNNDFGQSWFQYRTIGFDNLPAEYAKTFLDARRKMMNDAKIIATKRQTIVAAKNEAEGLVQVAAKAKLKQGLKPKDAMRPINVAQQSATALSVQAAALYREILMPTDASSPPQSIATSATSLDTNSKLKAWYQTPSNLDTSRGQWKSIEASYKNLTVKTTGLEKIVAVKKRSFRSNELSDSVVKAEVAKADKNVKDAKKLVALHKSNYAKGQKAFAKMEATFKKKK